MKRFFLWYLLWCFTQVTLAQTSTDFATLLAQAQQFFAQNDYTQTILVAEKSLVLLNEDTPEQLKNQALVRELIGNSHLYKGRNDLAVIQLQLALDLYKKSIGENTKSTADCYNHLGILYWNIGSNEDALAHLEKALSIRQRLFQENHAEVAASYNDIGLVYAQNQPFTALNYYEKALAIYQKVYPEHHPTIANAYTNIALIQLGQQQYELAIENLEKVLSIRKVVYGEQHPNEAFTYNSMAQVYKAMQQYTKALELHQQALNIYTNNYGEKHPEIANTYQQMAAIYLAKREYKAAAKACQKALVANSLDFNDTEIRQNPTSQNTYNPTIFLATLLLKAKIFEEQYFSKSLQLRDLKLALSCLQLCDKQITHLRRISENKNDQLALGNTAAEVYEDAIRLCWQLAEVTLAKSKYQQLAFEFAEKSKAAILLNAISDANAKQFAGIPTEVLEKEKSLKVEIAYYEQKLGEKGQNEAMIRNKIFDLNQAYDAFVKKMEQEYPAYYDLKLNVKTTHVAELQQYIPPKTAIISYFIAEKTQKLYIFKIEHNQFDVYEEPLATDLQKWITILRNAIRYQAPQEYVKVAYALKKQLLPFGLRQTHYICIPDGRLSIIPFEALLTHDIGKDIDFATLPYLLHKADFSYAYSHTLLLQQLKNQESKTNKISTATLIAPVNFEAMQLSSLTNTAIEVENIAQLCQAQDISTHVFLREQAQETILTTMAVQEADILHFATHGEVNEHYPDKSRIILSRDAQQKTDGICYAAEIYNWQFKKQPQLCVLSACQTALGKITRGEGIIGLTRPLLYVGVRNIVVSFWKVADDATMELMTSFYKAALSQSQGYAPALRQAKMTLIKSGKYSHPFYWSSFVLIGK